MKKINLPLILGFIIVISLLLIVIFEDDLMRSDPYALGEENLPPDNENIFGTDILGRDIYSRIVAGTKITLTVALLTTLLRFLIAIPLAFFSGFGGILSTKLIDFFSSTFSAIPVVVMSYIVLNTEGLKQLELRESIIAFSVVLAIVGWGRLSESIKIRIESILNEDFIEGEIAIGKNNILIAFQNVLPHLITMLVVAFFLEISNVLINLATLGLFGIYVGVDEYDLFQKLRGLAYKPNYHPEWGGMLSSSRYAISSGRPWIVLYPALMFFITISGFNLLGEGIQYEVDKRGSLVLHNIKRFLYNLLPTTYIYEIINFKKYRKKVFAKSIVIMVIISIIVVPKLDLGYKVKAVVSFNPIEELSKDKYEGRLVSTKGRDEACNYIVKELKKIGLDPIYDDKYIEKFKTKRPIPILKNSQIIISKEAKELKKYSLRKDFFINQIFFENKEDAHISPIKRMEGKIILLDDYKEENFDDGKKYFIIVDTNEFYEDSINLCHQIGKNPSVEGIIINIDDDDKAEDKDWVQLYNIEGKHNNPFIIEAKKEIVKELSNYSGNELSIENDVEIGEELIGKNIGAMIKGKTDEKPLVIVTDYDYLGFEKEMKYEGLYKNGTSISTILSIAKSLSEIGKTPDRNIIFAFLDSSEYYSRGAEVFGFSDYIKDDGFFIYVNFLGLEKEDNLYIDTTMITTQYKEHMDNIYYMRKKAKKLDISLEQEQVSKAILSSLRLNHFGSSGIVLSGIDSDTYYDEYYGTKQDNLDEIDRDKLEIQTQFILDSILHILGW